MVFVQGAGRPVSSCSLSLLSPQGDLRGREGRCWHWGAWGRALAGMSPRGTTPEEQRAVRFCETRWTLPLWEKRTEAHAHLASWLHLPAPRIRVPCCCLLREVPPALRQVRHPRRPRRFVPNSPVLTIISSLSVIPRPAEKAPSPRPESFLRAEGSSQKPLGTPSHPTPPRPLLACAVVPAAEVGVSEQVSG